jgi:hypothetical protein
MNRLVLLFFLLLISGIANSQAAKYFERIIYTPFPLYDEAWSIKSVQNGYLMAGWTATYGGEVQGTAVRTDLNGDVIWELIVVDTLNYTYFFDFAVVNDGYLFIGANYDTTLQLFRSLIYKTDTAGNIQWKKLLGDSMLNNYLTKINPTNDGGFIMCGHLEKANLYYDGYIMKADSAGNSQWSQQISGPLSNNNFSIVQLSNGTYLSAGHANFTLGSGSARIIKLDSLGNVFMDTSYIFQNNFTQSGYSILQSIDGNYIVCGESGSAGTAVRGLIFKTDTSGNILWSKLLTEFSNGSGSMYSSLLQSMKELPDSTIVCVGYLMPYTGIPSNERKFRLLIIKIDQNGDELWRRLYTPLPTRPTVGISIEATDDNGFIVCGRTDTINNANIYYIKTNCLGFIAPPDANFNVIVNGNDATFFNLSQNSDTCIYYFGDGDSALITSADTVPLIHTYPASGWYNVYMIAFACGESDTVFVPLYSGLHQNEILANPLTIHPNPATDAVYIDVSLPHYISTASIEIRDITGRVIEKVRCNPLFNSYVVNLDGYKSGIYMISLISENYKSNIKILVKL